MMTRLCCALGALFLLSRVLPLRAAPPRVNAPVTRQGRDTLVLDDSWRFQTDPNAMGATKSWPQVAPDSAQTVLVPDLWNQIAPGYKGMAWYWRSFDAPAAWRGQTVRLQFGAVADEAQVWLNGKELGAHTGGDTPFEFNVTNAIQPGAANVLAVRVDGDARRGAGMWQGVLLIAHDEAYLEHCFPRSDMYGNLSADIQLLNTSRTEGDAVLDARIITLDEPLKEVVKTHQNLHLTPGSNQTSLLATVKGKKLRLWTPETPVRYGLQLTFRQDNDVLDTTQIEFGFREFGFKAGQITVNRAPFTPVSLAPSPALPVVIATTEDTAKARDLLRGLKAKGVNVVHLDSPPPALLKIADAEGMLVVEGARQPGEATLRALILRDRAHPSILAWNLGASNSAFAREARKLDPTRFLLTTPPEGIPQCWPPDHDEPTDTIPSGL